MDDILQFQTAAAGPGAPIGYRDGGGLWLFAGEHYRPSFLMILRRRSPDGQLLWLLLRRLPRRLLEHVVSRYGDADPLEVADWDDEDLRDRVECLIQPARVKLFQLEAAEQSRLYDPDDPLVSRAGFATDGW